MKYKTVMIIEGGKRIGLFRHYTLSAARKVLRSWEKNSRGRPLLKGTQIAIILTKTDAVVEYAKLEPEWFEVTTS